MIARLAKRDDVVPFTQAQTGWEWSALKHDSVYVVEQDGKIIAVLIGAVVHNTLLLLRLVSTKESYYWMRPLFRFVEKDCLAKGISGCWSFSTCEQKVEKALLKLAASYKQNFASQPNHAVVGWRW